MQMEISEWQKDGYLVSTDKDKLDIEFIHQFLSFESYWSKGVPRTTVQKSIRHNLSFGVYLTGKQVAYAKVISDYATFAYLGDVFVDKNYRGKGIGKLLMESIMSHPELQNLRKWMLGTHDAHGLYKKFGFTSLKHPGRNMEKANPNPYGK